MKRGDGRPPAPEYGTSEGHAGPASTATGARAKAARYMALDLRDRWPLPWQYLLAVELIVGALWVRWLLDPLLDARLPFVTVFLVIMPLVLVVRTGPFLLATALGVLGVIVFFVRPRFSLFDPSAWLSAGLFMLAACMAAMTGWLVGRVRTRLERERFLAELAVRKSDAEHRALFDAAAVGNAELELATGRFLRVNRKFCELTGYGAAELLGGMSLAQITHPDDREATMEFFARFAREETPAYQVEQRYVQKDGAVMWVQVDGTLLRDADGRPLRILGVVQDITDRKRVEEERTALLESERAARADAEQASRAKDEFVATLSHELRTPINAVLGWTQLIRRGAVQGEELDRAVETIERNARIQARLIADLLDMTRIVAGKIQLELEPIDLEKIIASALAAVDQLAHSKGILIERDLDSRAAAARGDPARVEQVVWNLLTNAIKFTPAGGTVRVVLARVDSHAEITVQDSGRGIEPEFLTRIFERFTQADSSTTRKAGGLGLGLAISKHLIELQGGTIRAESEGPGKGASFVVALPLDEPAEEGDGRVEVLHPFRPEARLDGARLDGLRVLVVEDDPDSRKMVERVLAEHGARVSAADSVANALELLDQTAHDVVVSDIGMPDQDGYDLIRQLRERSPEKGGELPAIALTAYARPDDRARTLAAGYQAHVAKPVGADELARLVRSLVDRRSSLARESASKRG